jgi:hypothetical protein
MRVPVLAAVAASVVLFALPAAAHGWVENRDDTLVMARQCPLPGPSAAHAAVRCQVVVAPPVREWVGRVYHHQEMADRRGDGGDRDMYDDHGMTMRDDGDRVWDDRGRAFVDGAIHHEDEDRRGWDDHEYAQLRSGLRRDGGEARGRVYPETLRRAFLPGEHWIGPCGCGARPTAEQYGDVMWSAKLAPEAGPNQPNSDVHP